MRGFYKITSFSPWWCWLLLVLPLREGRASPNDVGHLSIVSKHEKLNTVKENDELSIVMNSTAFIDAVGSRIEQLMQKHALPKGGIPNCEMRCDSTSSAGGARKAFEIITSLRLSWHDALVYCKERKMNLATIRNLEDHKRMLRDIEKAGIKSGSFWIGGTILYSTRGWFWMSDGSPATYTNWLTGQPDDWGNSQKCMTYGWGWGDDIRWAWDDDRCFTTFPFACEYC